jgi:hypothetical protein
MSAGSEGEPASVPSRQPEPAPTQPPHLLAQLLLVASCVLALVFAIDVCMLLLTGNGSERRDFISYWAAGQQLTHHQNPYDAAATLRLERSMGFPPGGDALIVRNPPSALVLVAPLGWIGFRAAALSWSLLLLGCWLVSVRMLCSIEVRPTKRFDVFGYSLSPEFLLALFAPALACVLFGQTALFALLGLVLFLRLHRSNPFLAGVSLWLCALKPHLFLPFAAVLLLWIVVTRGYAVLAGAVVALGASSLVALRLDPSAWPQYAQMMRTVGLEREFIPCLSIALRFAVSPGTTWLQYLPAALGCIWAIGYFWTRRSAWDWAHDGPLLVLVSMLVSPYAWLTDQVLAIPALLVVAHRASFRSLLVLALASSAIEIAILCGLYLHSAFYLGTQAAWLAWFLIVQYQPSRADSASH